MRQGWQRILLMAWLALMSFCAALARPAEAPAVTHKALLVGVSEYPTLAANKQLSGPRNDVSLVRDFLLKRGTRSENITVLADGVKGAALPTRANILRELDRLATSAQASDYIVIYLAGHGSQVPISAADINDLEADENDGLFEVFLPRDVGKWQSKGRGLDGQIENALYKRELRSRVNRMLSSGAAVWSIVDACHSAGLVRAAEEEGVRLRQVSPADLGVPERPPAELTRSGMAPGVRQKPQISETRQAAGGIHFYAAQTYQQAAEMDLPAGAPDRRRFGLFTYHLIGALESATTPMTYRQLAQQVLLRFSATGNVATPAFTGAGLDTGVLGDKAMRHRQWELIHDPANQDPQRVLRLRAGQLAGVFPGAVVAVLPDAITRTEGAMGFARVRQSTALESTLEPISYRHAPKVGLDRLSAGQTARLVAPSFDFTLRLQQDLSGCAKPCPFADVLNPKPSTAGAADSTESMGWTRVRSGPDLLLRALGNRLWLLPSGMSTQELPNDAEKRFGYVDAGPRLNERLREALQSVGKGVNVLRLLATFPRSQTTDEVSVHLLSRDGKDVKPAQVRAGAEINLLIKNLSPVAKDVNVLYVDSKFQFSVLYPRKKEELNRLPRCLVDRCAIQVPLQWEDSTVGPEHLVVISADEAPQREALRLDYLQDGSPPPTTRGSPRLDALFRQAGFPVLLTRGEAPMTANPDVAIKVVNIFVNP